MNLPALLEALAANPGAVLAWDLDLSDPTLSVYAVDGGVRQLAYASIEPAQRKATRAELSALGYPQGTYELAAAVVWRGSPAGFDVWAADGGGLHADATTLSVGAATLTRSPDLEVVAFVDPDHVRRGVLVRAAGVEHLVALHRNLRPTYDWSYGELDASSDSLWVTVLGLELAAALGARFTGP